MRVASSSLLVVVVVRVVALAVCCAGGQQQRHHCLHCGIGHARHIVVVHVMALAVCCAGGRQQRQHLCYGIGHVHCIVIVIAGGGGGLYRGTGSVALVIDNAGSRGHGRVVHGCLIIVVVLAWMHYHLHHLWCACVDMLPLSQVVMVHR